MSAERDETRIVRSWLEEGATLLPDRVLDAVLDQIPTTPQRRALWPAWRFLHVNGYTRFAAVAAAAAIVIIGVAVATRPSSVGPPAPTVVPTPTPPPLLNKLPTGVLAAGTYEIDAVFPVRFSFTLPSGFDHGRGAADGVGIGHPGESGVPRGIEFQIAANVYPDPCHHSSGPASPPIGPGVDDLVTAMTTMIGVEPGAVTDVNIGGVPAKAFDLTTEIDTGTCDEGQTRTFVFAGSSGTGGIGPGQRQRVYVLEAQGTRLMIMTYYFPNGDTTSDAAAAEELRAIVESIEFR